MDNLSVSSKRYRASGVVLFFVALGLIGARISASFISDAIEKLNLDAAYTELLIDGVFTFIVQIVFLFVLPLIIMRSAMDRDTLIAHCSLRKPKKSYIGYAFAIGIFVVFASTIVSSFSAIFLRIIGYNYPDTSTAMPERFDIFYFLISVVLTAVLPGICEEFTNRGVFVGAIRDTFGRKATIILGGLIFGLFHQNIAQTVYTAVFGMFITWLMLTTNSIVPGIIVHFMNNFASVMLQSAREYNWLGYGALSENSIGMYVLFTFGMGIIAIVTIVMLSRSLARRSKADGDGYVMSEYVYRPTLMDNAFLIGGLVMMLLATLMTYIVNVY